MKLDIIGHHVGGEKIFKVRGHLVTHVTRGQGHSAAKCTFAAQLSR